MWPNRTSIGKANRIVQSSGEVTTELPAWTNHSHNTEYPH